MHYSLKLTVIKWQGTGFNPLKCSGIRWLHL